MSHSNERQQLEVLDRFLERFGDCKCEGTVEWLAEEGEHVTRPFVVHSLLSEDECSFLRKHIEYDQDLHWPSRDGSETPYRKNLRVMLKHQGFANFLLARILPHLPKTIVIPEGTAEIGGMSEGTWAHDGINNMLRFCKYSPGGVFRPHYDGLYATGVDHRSLLTLMFYLNGDYKGGATNFLEPPENASCEVRTAVTRSIQPDRGLCICFPHNIYHEGCQLLDGEKYILRTEVMYRRVSPPKTAEEMSKKEQADTLFMMAEDLERSGRHAEAANCYRKAFKLNPDLERL